MSFEKTKMSSRLLLFFKHFLFTKKWKQFIIYAIKGANGFDFERRKEYQKTDKYKKAQNKYDNQLCSYNGEVLTLCALAARFRKAGIPHSKQEAKKYLLVK